MSEARINRISNEKGDGGPSLSGITTFSGLNYFVPPKGTTAERPSDCPPGSIRFNTDSAHLEYWDGLQWLEFESTNDELGISNNAAGTSGGLGHRALVAGGFGPTPSSPSTNQNTIQYLTIPTLGNTQDFGDLTAAGQRGGSCASRTRGYFQGRADPGTSQAIDTIVFSSTGDATDYGDLTVASNFSASCSNQSRGIHATATTSNSTNIDYFNLDSTGIPVSFGNLTVGRNRLGALSSSTRGIFGGGYINGSGNQNIIDYVTISTTGNAIDFGDATYQHHALSGSSSSTRGIFAGTNNYNSTPISSFPSIEFITIASTGNSQTFGDLSDRREYFASMSSTIRSVFAGGQDASILNVIDYITISTTGNAVDFGDLAVDNDKIFGTFGCSNGHGGL